MMELTTQQKNFVATTMVRGFLSFAKEIDESFDLLLAQCDEKPGTPDALVDVACSIVDSKAQLAQLVTWVTGNKHADFELALSMLASAHTKFTSIRNALANALISVSTYKDSKDNMTTDANDDLFAFPNPVDPTRRAHRRKE